MAFQANSRPNEGTRNFPVGKTIKKEAKNQVIALDDETSPI